MIRQPIADFEEDRGRPPAVRPHRTRPGIHHGGGAASLPAPRPCSIYNGISGGSGGSAASLGVPDLGTFKALLIVLVALIFPFPINLLVMAGMATLLLPTSFGRALVVSLIQTGLFVLVSLLLIGFVVLLFSVNGPWLAGGRPYNLIEIAVFVAVALLSEVPVFYASTALTGYEPNLIKTFVVPIVTAGI